MRIKTTVIYHLAPLRIAILTKSVGRGVQEKEPLCTVGGNVNRSNHSGKWSGVSSILKLQLPKRASVLSAHVGQLCFSSCRIDLKNKTTVGPSNSTSEYLSEENKNTNSKTCMWPVYCSIICSSQDNLSVQWWINVKEIVVCLYSGMLSSPKGHEILPFVPT